MLEHEGVHDIAEEVFVYTHKQFSIAYNGDQIIEVNLTSEAPAALDEGVYVWLGGCQSVIVAAAAS